MPDRVVTNLGEPFPFEESVVVPDHLPRCPYCGANLIAYAESWTDEDGLWLPDGIVVDCKAEPPIASPEWHGWFESHSYMPYVYQLPVDLQIQAWMHEQIRKPDLPQNGE